MRKLFGAALLVYFAAIALLFEILPKYDVYMSAPLDTVRVTSEYGYRWGRLHKGVDLAADRGDAVYSVCGGTVAKAESAGSFGRLVEVVFNENITVYYAHLDSIDVTKGVQVARGQIIGRAGSSGNATGPHLHLEIRYSGKAKNPAQFIDKIGGV